VQTVNYFTCSWLRATSFFLALKQAAKVQKMKRHSSIGKDSEELIRRLKSEVGMLTRMVTAKLPQQIQEILGSHRDCEDRASVFRWMDGAIEKLIDLSDKRPSSEMGEYMGTGERAYCALCGGGSQGPYPPEGFAWPEGLRRHLAGTYNSRQCELMMVIKNDAIDDTEDEDLQRMRRAMKEGRAKKKG
jgi:hypothetical protein